MNDIVINVKDATKKFEKYTVLNKCESSMLQR